MSSAKERREKRQREVIYRMKDDHYGGPDGYPRKTSTVLSHDDRQALLDLLGEKDTALAAAHDAFVKWETNFLRFSLFRKRALDLIREALRIRG